MPGSMHGLGLARVIRSECPELKIILISAHHTSLEGLVPEPEKAMVS
jgi:hypothetical protein